MIRTKDIDIINTIVTHNDIYPFIVDDGSPKKSEYSSPENDEIYYLLGKEGLIIYSPLNYITYETHWCILPKYRGKSASFIKETIEWMFKNTVCRKIEGRIPENNRRAYLHAKRIGFYDEGISKNSFMKDGEIYNMNILGVESCLGDQ